MSANGSWVIKCDGGGSEPCSSQLGPRDSEVEVRRLAHRSSSSGWTRGRLGKDLCPKCTAIETTRTETP